MEAQAPEDSRAEERTNIETLNEDVDYECRSWNVNEGMFQPPSNVEFVDMNAMMEGVMNNMQGMMGDLENLPAPQ